MVGAYPEERNKISTITCRLKGQSAKISVPCPEIINSGMGGVDLLDQKTAGYKLDRKSSVGCYCLRLFFDPMNISVVNSYAIYKVLYPKGTKFFWISKLFWLNCWFLCIIVAVEIHQSVMCLAEKNFYLVSHYISQFFKQREENENTAILEGLKTKHTFNVIHVKFFVLDFRQ